MLKIGGRAGNLLTISLIVFRRNQFLGGLVKATLEGLIIAALFWRSGRMRRSSYSVDHHDRRRPAECARLAESF
jgi:hypothetical protein